MSAQEPSKKQQQPTNKNNESPSSDVEEETETGSTAEAAYEYSPEPASVFGNLRTRLRWASDVRTLLLDVRQVAQSRRKLEVRYKGRLNTHTGDYQHVAQVQRIMTQNTLSLARVIAAEQGMRVEGEEDIDNERFLPAGLHTLLFKDWTMGPGIRVISHGTALPPAPAATAGAAAAAGAGAGAGAAGDDAAGSSSSSGLRYCVTFRKQPQVLWRRGVWDSWLEGKADIELNPAQQSVGLCGAVRLKVLRLNVTDKQDVQVTVGADYVSSNSSSSSWALTTGGSSSSVTPYVKLSENSWAVRLCRGALSFTYDM